VVSKDFKNPNTYTARSTFDLNENGDALPEFTFGHTYTADVTVMLDAIMVNDGFSDHLYNEATQHDKETQYPWGFGSASWRLDGYVPQLYDTEPDPNEPEPEPYIPKEVFINVNSIKIRALPGLEVLMAKDVKLSLDIDSFAWRCSFTVLNQESFDLIEPTVAGVKEIEVEINGYFWNFFVDEYDEFRTSNGPKRWSVNGLSLTKNLSAPYAYPESYAYDSATTAIQIANNAVVPFSGFSLTWNTTDIPDWAVPADVFSYVDKTPIEVIAQVASTFGGVVIPHRSNKSFTVQKRYKSLPWDYATATPDLTIHENVLLNTSFSWRSQKLIDRLWVSGVDSGQLVDIRRNGSGLDVSGDMIAEPLILTQAVAINRGGQEIAKTGKKGDYTFTLPLFQSGVSPSLAGVGDLVELQHTDAGKDWRGLITSVTIQAEQSGGRSIRQVITVERSYE
jgi:hypothetical protein